GSVEVFTVIQLFVEIIILAILLAIAIPSFLILKDRPHQSATHSPYTTLFRSIESYNADNTVGNTTNDPDGATDTTHSDSGYQGIEPKLLSLNSSHVFTSSAFFIWSKNVGGATPTTANGITANGAFSTTNYCVV